jgi:glycosyltransferase involved in cell wall biosynthesis
MQNKIIWVINQTAGKPNSGWGERHYFLSKYWKQQGYDIKIISGSYNHLFLNQPKVSSKTFTLEEIEEGIHFCWVKIPKYDASSIFKLWSMVVFAIKVLFLKPKLLGKPDIIIVSSMPIFPILSGIYLKGKWKAKKLLFEIRDLWPLSPMHLSGYSKYHPMILLMAWIERMGYRKSDSIVSLLPNAYKYIDAISKEPGKTHWISNGIDNNLLEQKELDQDIKEQIPKNKFIIGYAGTMGMANALEPFIQASVLLKKDDSIHFVLVGNGYLKNQLMEATQGNKNITFIDKIDKSQIQDLLTLFDVCFIGRNNTELFDYGVASNKYFDYMLAKKPILESSNKIKSPAELANCCFNVPPDDAKAIVKGILELQQLSTTKLKSIGLNGYNYVLNYHNFDYLSTKYRKLF